MIRPVRHHLFKNSGLEVSCADPGGCGRQQTSANACTRAATRVSVSSRVCIGPFAVQPRSRAATQLRSWQAMHMRRAGRVAQNSGSAVIGTEHQRTPSYRDTWVSLRSTRP